VTLLLLDGGNIAEESSSCGGVELLLPQLLVVLLALILHYQSLELSLSRVLHVVPRVQIVEILQLLLHQLLLYTQQQGRRSLWDRGDTSQYL